MTTISFRSAPPPPHGTRSFAGSGALEMSGVVVSMATTNPFTHQVFKDGALTSNDPAVRRYAIAKAMRGIDLGVELGARTYVFWGGGEGVEAMAAKPAIDALERYREAMNFLAAYVRPGRARTTGLRKPTDWTSC